MASCPNGHVHLPKRANGKPHRGRRLYPSPHFHGEGSLCATPGAGAAVSRCKGQDGHPLPRKSASAGRFKPLSWTTRHNLNPPWGKNLARMGPCGLTHHTPKHYRPGGRAGRRPVRTRTRTHARPRLPGFMRKHQAENHPFFANTQAPAYFISPPQPHAQARCLRPRNACVMWARILLPCPGFTPLHRFLLSRKYFCPPVLSRPFNRLMARGGLCARPRGNPWHFSIPWFDFHHALMLALPAE